jgi:HEPN domain-containing protein
MKRITRQWLRKAQGDLVAARHLFKLKPLPNDEICFHCQQSIEKYLKGLLAEHALPIQKTHDLVVLLHQLLPVRPVVKSIQSGLKSVTRYAVEYRYPGMNTTARQSRSAYEKALHVRQVIRNCLGLPPDRMR